MSRGVERGEIGGQGVEELTRDVALQAAQHVAFGEALGGAACGVGARAVAVAQADQGDGVQRGVGVAIAVRIETMACAVVSGPTPKRLSVRGAASATNAANC